MVVPRPANNVSKARADVSSTVWWRTSAPSPDLAFARLQCPPPAAKHLHVADFASHVVPGDRAPYRLRLVVLDRAGQRVRPDDGGSAEAGLALRATTGGSRRRTNDDNPAPGPGQAGISR
jgi:hypothetical protein